MLEWPWNDNRYILTNNRNFTFNVTSSLANTSLKLTFKNHFTNQKTVISGLTTDASSGIKKVFSFDIDDSVASGGLGLTNGPHDVQIELLDGSDSPPEDFFFIDIFPDSYDMQAWTDQSEYKSGDYVNINVEVHNVSNNWQVTPTNVVLDEIRDPFGQLVSSPTFAWSGNKANISTTGFFTGNYHAELNITVGGTSRTVPLDFFVKGNDDLKLFWQQEKWDYSSTDTFSLQITAKDGEDNAEGVSASLIQFGKRPQSYDQEPTPINLSGHYNFTPDSQTDSDGKVTLRIDLASAGLETGAYTGGVNIGGQTVWFDFQVRTYQVDAYTSEWEYGITDTIEINARARNFDTGNPITENGTINITRINKHEPGSWQPTEVNLSDFGLTQSNFSVVDGEILIEMQPDQAALALNQTYEFEVELDMNLETSGKSTGWALFRLSNGTKPAATIIDGNGDEVTNFFADQVYTLQVTGVTNATLKNIWGPMGDTYDEPLVNTGSVLELNFTTPNMPGRYTMEIEINRGESNEYLYKDFTIGSGTEINAWTVDGSDIIPSVNFTVVTELFGEGKDPWCTNCGNNKWFGPLGNKTITLTGIKNLQTFQTRDVSGLGISAITNSFPQVASCWDYNDEQSCNAEDLCEWQTDESGGFCQNIPNDVGMKGLFSEPGMTSFNLRSDILNITAGNKYNLIFEYVDENFESHTSELFVSVEKFHTAISKNENNLQPKSKQPVWMMTSDLYGEPISNCNISFAGIYNEKDYQLVKALSVNGTTNENGTYVFNYITPALPGQYLVSGEAVCDVSGEQVKQEISYFINVGTKSFVVDMKTKFNPDENVKIIITTKDSNGNPKSQKIDINLFHNLDGYTGTINSVGGVDCTPLSAGPQWSAGGEQSQESNLQMQTDETGVLELELCPMPRGDYSADIFPIFDFNQQIDPQSEDQFGYSSDFVVGSGDLKINTDLRYEIGDMVTMIVNVTDDEGNAVNGSLVAMDAVMDVESSGPNPNKITLYENDSLNVSLVNGVTTYAFTIPVMGKDDKSGNLTQITPGPVDVFARVVGTDGTAYTKSGVQFVIVSSSESSLSAKRTVGTNELIAVHVQAQNDARYKSEVGIFFLKENSASEKQWLIEGGVFLRNDTNNSYADFQILSPKEPGEYLLGIPIFPIELSPKEATGWSELLITPITVKLDTVNVSGKVIDQDNQPIENALVQIGKAEDFTDANGDFDLEVAKGKKTIYVEKKGVNKYFMKSTSTPDFSANVANLTVKLYKVELSGGVSPTTVYINQSTNLTTTYLNVSVNLNNTRTGATTLTGSNLSIKAKSGKVVNLDLGVGVNTQNVLVYPENKSDDYEVIVRFKNDIWASSSYMVKDGTPINNTVGSSITFDYTVESTLSSVGNFSGYCGDGVCLYSEIDTCSIDCGGVLEVCGDNIIQGTEKCDGADLDGSTCQDLGFVNGTLGCLGDCRDWDVSQCNWAGENPPGNSTGNQTPAEATITILSPENNNKTNVTEVNVTYQITGDLSNYLETKLYLYDDSGNVSMTNVTIDPGEGIFSFTFKNVGAGALNINATLVNITNKTVDTDKIKIYNGWTYITCTGSLPADAIMYIDGLPRQNCLSANPYGIKKGFHKIVLHKDGYENYTENNTHLIYGLHRFNSPYEILVNLSLMNQSNTSGGGGPGSASLSGQVIGSIIPNATIEIINASNMQIIDTLFTDANGEFNISLVPGLYNAFVQLPSWYEFRNVEIEVRGINVSGAEELNFFVPHISGVPFLNGVPIIDLMQAMQVNNGSATNISVMVNSSDTMNVNASMILNATAVGDTATYNGDSVSLTGQSIGQLSYVFFPTILGINNLYLDFNLQINAADLINGTVNPVMVNAWLNEVEIPINVTGPQQPSGTNPNITITKTLLSPQGGISQGDTMLFELEITNTGDMDFGVVPVNDYFGSCIQFLNASVVPDLNNGTIVNWNDLTQNFGGALAPSVSFQLYVNMQANCSVNNTFNRAEAFKPSTINGETNIIAMDSFDFNILPSGGGQ